MTSTTDSEPLKTTTSIFVSGNSIAVRISNEIQEVMALDAGDEVTLQFDPATQTISIKKTIPHLKSAKNLKIV